ncbi:Protein muscleblind [Aphelenchoides fujianensis]|nr:Protein muscleblind [Aphelenchoides fujianensis]
MFDENSNSTGIVGPTVTAPSSNLNGAQMVNQLLTMKDSRWLQLEVCREFQRGQCSRSDADCKFAHPPAHVDVQNGRVTACYDSIKGRCTRENPKCKYMHPTPQQKEQLLVNGKNNLALKNMICAQIMPQAGLQNNLQLAQLMQQQQQQQPLMPTLPYPFYSPLTAIYPFAGADPYSQVQTPPLVARQLALLQQQQQSTSVAAPAAVGGLPNAAALNAAAAAQPQPSAAVLQLLQQQAAAAAQLYGGAGATSPPLAASLVLQQQQQAALAAAVAAAQQQQAAVQTPDSRKRSARSAGFEEGGEEKKANVNGLPMPANGAPLPPAVSAAAPTTTAVTSAAEMTAAQYSQLLIAAAVLRRTRRTEWPTGSATAATRTACPHGIPIYQAAAQFNPYMMQQMPGFVPVSFNGQLPPRL